MPVVAAVEGQNQTGSISVFHWNGSAWDHSSAFPFQGSDYLFWQYVSLAVDSSGAPVVAASSLSVALDFTIYV